MASSQASWSWHNLSSDLTSPAAVTAFFRGDTPVEFYQDAFYAAAGKSTGYLTALLRRGAHNTHGSCSTYTGMLCMQG